MRHNTFIGSLYCLFVRDTRGETSVQQFLENTCGQDVRLCQFNHRSYPLVFAGQHIRWTPGWGLHGAHMHDMRGCKGPLGTKQEVLEDDLSRSGGADHKE